MIENIVYPADAGVIDVTKTPYNADSTGVADATAAIQSAINAARGYLKGKTVYLPNGRYRITNRLVFTTDQAVQRTLVFQGQSRTRTILKLQDNLPAAATNLPVIKCFEPATGTQSYTNNLFSTSICNLTINTGAGNPGAVGIAYLASNQGNIRNVYIKSGDAGKTGRSGIEVTASIPGPALLKNVTVEGFNVGIRAALLQYGLTLENITLRNQLQYGLTNNAQTLAIRHLLSQNTVPAISQTAGGQSKGIITLIDSQLNGGAAASYGIELTDGFLFARNVSTTGYAAALTAFGTPVAGNSISEYVSGTTYSTQTLVQPTSLNLPIQETPEVPLDPLSSWKSVSDFGAVPGDGVDDTQAIQNALNSSYSTVYFPNSKNVAFTGAANITLEDKGSRYEVSGTLVVGPSVKRLMGLCTSIFPTGTFSTSTANLPIFQFVNNGVPRTIVMEGFRTAGKDSRNVLIEQASNNTLVLRNISVRNAFGYRNTGTSTGVGDVFIEDFHSIPLINGTPNSYLTSSQPGFLFKNQRAWCRQLNPEQNSVNVVNDGGTVWILGLKTELPNVVVETKNGGQTEVLGGLTLPSIDPGTQPTFINNNSSMSVAGFGEARSTSSKGVYSVVVEETRGTTVSTLAANTLPTRKAEQDASLSFVLPLYTGYSRDLRVMAITWGPAAPTVGQAVTFSATIKNFGNTATPAVKHGVRFSVDGTVVNWSSYYVSALAPGQQVTVNANGGPNGGSSTWTATGGGHQLTALVDDTDLIAENDETNNVGTAALNISAMASPVQDAYVRGGTYATTQHGTTDPTQLLTKHNDVLDYEREAYITFSLANLPGPVSAAKLRLYKAVTGAPAGTIAIGAYSVAAPSWQETTLTWNTKPAAGATPLVSASAPATAGYVEWDVSAYVADQKSQGKTTVGFALKNIPSAAETLVWNAKEATANRPELVLDFGAVPAARQALASAVSAGLAEVTAYPNPARDAVTVELRAVSAQVAIVRLTSALGQVVQERLVPVSEGMSRHSLDTASLATGLYLLTVQQGPQRITKRIVITR